MSKIENIILSKVKNVYFNFNPDSKAHPLFTGLVIELEDGRVFRHQSTDPVMPFQEVPGGIV